MVVTETGNMHALNDPVLAWLGVASLLENGIALPILNVFLVQGMVLVPESAEPLD